METKCKLPKKLPISKLIEKSLKFLSTTVVIVSILSYVLEIIFGINKLYVYLLVGLLCSIQATYYKFRVWFDPNYKPTNCDCAESPSFSQDVMNGIFTVLSHEKGSMLLNIPNSAFGILFYSFLILINYLDLDGSLLITKSLISLSCLGSIYLWYVMIFEVRSVCLLCATIYSVNFLTLVKIFF